MEIKLTQKQVQIERLKEKLRKLRTPVDKNTAHAIGALVVKEMSDMIGKGISPIEGAGRFPAYKAQTRVKVLNKLAKSASGRGDKAKAKSLRSKSKDAKKGYPYNTKEFKEGKKRDRPVNLFLTGDMMRDLTYEPIERNGSWLTEIGYFTIDSILKEIGHRDGVNGQPKRPTLPQGQEGFAQRIQRILFRIYQERVRHLLGK